MIVQVTYQQKFIDFANIFKAFIGSIYLTMPFAFRQSGIILGVIMLLMMGLINDHCCSKIVRCKATIIGRLTEQLQQKLDRGLLPEPEAELVRSGRLRARWEDRMTLAHIAKYVFGKKGQWLVTVCLFLSQFGFCTGYMVFVGSTIHDIIYGNVPTTPKNITNTTNMTTSDPQTTIPNIDLIYLVIIPLPVFALFSLVRSIRNLGWVSIFANITIVVGFFTVLGIMFNGFAVSKTYRLANLQTVAVVFGLLTTAFEGIGTVIPIESSMVGNRHNFPVYLHTTLAGIMLILGLFGVLGNLRYGDDTAQIILQNLPASHIVTAVNVVLIASVICTYPLQMFPCVEIAEFLFFRKRSSELNRDRLQQLDGEIGDDGGVSDHFTDNEAEEELLAELSASESEEELEEQRKKIRRRRYRKGTTSIAGGGDLRTYGATIQRETDTELSPGLEVTPVEINQAKQTDPPCEAAPYTKKQERMIRIVHGTKITAASWKRNIIRVVLVVAQLGLAIVMRKNYAYLSAFIGAIGSSVLAYMLPGATHFKLTRNDPNTNCAVRVFDVFLVLFGVVGSTVTLVVTISQMVAGE